MIKTKADAEGSAEQADHGDQGVLAVAEGGGAVEGGEWAAEGAGGGGAAAV